MRTMEEEMQEGTQVDEVFGGTAIPVPPFQPDAHRVTITAVGSGHSSDKGTPFIEIFWRSIDVPTLERTTKVWIPREYEEAGFPARFDTKTMAEGQQISYRLGIRSSDNSATLQILVENPDSIAKQAGRDPVELGLKRATTLEEYADNLNKMLQGIDCIITRKARGGDDPAFANTPEVKRWFPIDIAERRPKVLKGLQLAWKQE